jgi:bifunctional DNA-binding transcriptional regulator/antitoxin component of YhaV-PrlF toxin-antitoxin module
MLEASRPGEKASVPVPMPCEQAGGASLFIRRLIRRRKITVEFDFAGRNKYSKFYQVKKEVNAMPQSAVSTKGQITLPLAYRKKYDINPKDLVTIEDTGEAIIIRKARNFLAMEGMLGATSTVAEERAAAMEGATRHSLGNE